MASRTGAILSRLEGLRRSFGPAEAAQKLTYLRTLETASCGSAREVLRLHELLCFARAYPDEPALLAQTRRMLARFHERTDLRRFRDELTGTGIAGTPIRYSFYWLTACWLVRKWPHAVTILWGEFNNKDKLNEYWHLLLPPADAMAIDGNSYPPREWINRFKRGDETDAAFLVRRFQAWRVDAATKEYLYESLDVPMRVEPGLNTPSRTRSCLPVSAVFAGTTGTVRSPALDKPLLKTPLSIRRAEPRLGRRLFDLAKVQMITRNRDLFAFTHADVNDIRLIDYEGGLRFVAYGIAPAQRMLLEALYVFLILKNGVPIGYTQAYTLFRSAEVNFNIFDSYRGMEASIAFSATLAMIRHMFGCDAFIINAQQLGQGNTEALKTGAFWFYHKHRFRPQDPEVRQVLRRELEARRSNPDHRSSVAVLRQLAQGDMCLFLGRPRSLLVNTLKTENIGLACTRLLAIRFGSAREKGLRRCEREAVRLLGARGVDRWPKKERAMMRQWSPLVLALPGIHRWSAANKTALVRIIRAKGGGPETDYIKLFDRHRALQSGLVRLAQGSGKSSAG